MKPFSQSASTTIFAVSRVWEVSAANTYWQMGADPGSFAPISFFARQKARSGLLSPAIYSAYFYDYPIFLCPLGQSTQERDSTMNSARDIPGHAPHNCRTSFP